MSRLDKERQEKLEPTRLKKALKEFEKIDVKIVCYSDTAITIQHKGKNVLYHAYSGWATGKTIKDGRGLKNLLKQIKN